MRGKATGGHDPSPRCLGRGAGKGPPPWGGRVLRAPQAPLLQGEQRPCRISPPREADNWSPTGGRFLGDRASRCLSESLALAEAATKDALFTC